MCPSARRAPFLVTLFPLLFAMQASAQETCPTLRNYYPRIGYSGYGLTIEGSNLRSVTEVKFSENVSAVFEILNDGQIAVTVPLGAVSGPITIGKPGCPGAATDLFIIPPPPAISLTPESHTIAAGATAPVNVNFSSALFVPSYLTLSSSSPDVVLSPSFLVVPPSTVQTKFDVKVLKSGATATITATLPANLGGVSATMVVNAAPEVLHVVRSGEASGVAGGLLGFPIQTEARGDEQQIQFSLTFNPEVLGNPDVFLGMSLGYDTIITADMTQIAQGRLGIVLKFPAGQPLTAGSKEIAYVRFNIAGNAPSGPTPLGFGDQPTPRRITSPGARPLRASFIAATATITR